MNRHKKFSSLGNEVQPYSPYITKLRKITKIVFHCSATPDGRDVTIEDIDRMHRERWGQNSGCGYHFLIDIHGKVKKGRWSDTPGSHAGPNKKIGRKSSNPDTIAVVYAGGVDSKLRALKSGMNSLQRDTAVTLLWALKNGYGLKIEDIIGHNELPLVNKGCPCEPMDELRERIKNAYN